MYTQPHTEQRCWALCVSDPQMHSCSICLFWWARCCESSPIMILLHCALRASISMQPCSLVMLIVVGAPLWVMLNRPICCALVASFQPWSVAFLSSILRNGPSPSVSGLRSKQLSPSRTGFFSFLIDAQVYPFTKVKQVVLSPE